jgi:hypothetical protein
MNQIENILSFKEHFNPNSSKLTFKFFQAESIIPTTRPIITYDKVTIEFINKLERSNQILVPNYMKIIESYTKDVHELPNLVLQGDLDLVKATLTFVMRTEHHMNGNLIDWVQNGTLYNSLYRLDEINN